MDEQDKRYSWHYTIYHYEEKTEIEDMKLKYADISSVLSISEGVSPAQAHSRIYKRGLEEMHKELSGNEKDEFLAEAAELRKKIEKEARELASLKKTLQTLGREAFDELCHKHGKDPDEIIEKIDFTITYTSWTEKAWDWLCTRLEDGEIVPTYVIKDEATKAGIITHFDNDNGKSWGNLRQLASRNGLTKHTHGDGLWQLPKKYRPVEYR